MYIPVFLITGIVVLIFQTANGQGEPCPGTPARCFPTGNVAAGTTCITSANNGSGNNWYQMEDNCKRNNGRLVWLRDDMDIDHVLHTTAHREFGALLALGLLSSTSDNVGLFWRNPSDYSSFQCDCTDTKSCLSNSTAEICAATGCCWRNGQCQYPHSQSLPTFNVNKTQLKMSYSTVRQCVGFQLNANSSTHGQWVSYDCFKPGSNAVYVCEYKCNTASWPKTHVTDFMHVDTTTQAPISTTGGTQGSSVTPDNNSISTTGGPQGSSVTPDNNASSTTGGPQGSSVTPDNNAISTTGGTQGSGVKHDNNSFLKVLLSLETGGAMTNMSFSLQQASP